MYNFIIADFEVGLSSKSFFCFQFIILLHVIKL